jgi:hypothetical protein
MNSPLTVDEIRSHFHPILDGYTDWRPDRFEAAASGESVNSYDVIITIVRPNGEQKRLKFTRARLPASCPGVRLNMWRGSIYVADISSVQWEGLTVGVGALEEEYATAFFASSVEQII